MIRPRALLVFFGSFFLSPPALHGDGRSVAFDHIKDTRFLEFRWSTEVADCGHIRRSSARIHVQSSKISHNHSMTQVTKLSVTPPSIARNRPNGRLLMRLFYFFQWDNAQVSAPLHICTRNDVEATIICTAARYCLSSIYFCNWQWPFKDSCASAREIVYHVPCLDERGASRPTLE